MRRTNLTRAYKELHMQQLRSFLAVAEYGTQAEAARRLGLSQPTIWEQVHALERKLGVLLLKVHAKTCRLTEDGLLLARLAGSVVSGFDRLALRFHEQRGAVQQRLRVAASPRMMQEDLPECVVQFEKDHSGVELSLLESIDDRVWRFVDEREVDIGLTPAVPPAERSLWLEVVPCYELEQVLLAPRDHPLARKRVVCPEDLLNYPIVNGLGVFSGPGMRLFQEQIASSPATRSRVAATYAATIRTYVKRGFGIGIVPLLPNRMRDSDLHERSMSRYFGRLYVNFIKRRHAALPPAVDDFFQTVQRLLGAPGTP